MKFSYSLIKKLFPSAPAKVKLAEALDLHSFETENLTGDLLEISLPTNRYSDAASHLGIAREAATIFGRTLKNPVTTIVNPPTNKGFVNIEIEKPGLCPRYAARYFTIKKVSPSPLWVQAVLKTCGLKPINNIVDLMNYVMLEVGQPLHAFDADALAVRNKKGETRHIVVRRARKGEHIETLDGQKIALDSEIVVIADDKAPLAIAGVKGGRASGVCTSTRRIIVEAANFDPVSVFQTSRKLKLQTDAALRFSHGVSPALVQWGMDRVTKLLRNAGAELLDSVDVYLKKVSDEVIEFSANEFTCLIGGAVSLEKARKIFERLGFTIEKIVRRAQSSTLLVRVPAWRTDVQTSEDLAEEVSRMLGYNTLRPAPPLVSIQPSHEEDVVIFKDKLRKLLTSFQLDETYNSSFLGGEDLRGPFLALRTDARSLVELENPVAEDKKYLRPSLLPLLVKNVRDNSRFFDEVRIFEIGKAFAVSRGIPEEHLELGIALGAKKAFTVLTPELKGIVGELLEGLGVGDEVRFREAGTLRLSVESDHSVLGEIRLAPLEKNWEVALLKLDLEKTMDLTEEEKEFTSIKKFPAVVRDVSVLLGKDARIGEVVAAIQDASPRLVENIELTDEYVDEKFGGKQSVTFRIIFQAEDRTLTDREVNREAERIAAALRKKFRAEIR